MKMVVGGAISRVEVALVFIAVVAIEISVCVLTDVTTIPDFVAAA